MTMPVGNRGRKTRVPLDAPGAAEGAGSFRHAGALSTEHPQTIPTRSSPVGRRACSSDRSDRRWIAPVAREDIIAHLADLLVGNAKRKGFEGCKEFLYADSEGNVTVGVGHLVAKKTTGEREVRSALAEIPLVHQGAGVTACSGSHEDHKYEAYQEVRRRYDAKFDTVFNEGVKLALEGSNVDPFSVDSPGTARAVLGAYGKDPTKGKNKLSADAYSQTAMRNLPTAEINAELRLAPDGARQLLEGDLKRKYAEAVGEFSDFDKLPVGVKLVVLDILFNGRGIGGHGGWKKFKKAIRERDWVTALDHCGAGKDRQRDEWRKRQLRDQILLDQLQRRLDRFGNLYIA
jgi:hypothetical protein